MSALPPQADPVRAQIESLRSKLLDLTLRNRMLNYRPSRKIGITVVGEESFQLHRILIEEGKKMSFVGRPDPVDRHNRNTGRFAPTDVAVIEEFRQAAEEELEAFFENAPIPLDTLDTKLSTDDLESVLQAKLRMIAREATTAREELGINTLFLTLGALEWSETEERSYRAPLLYVPVLLERQANGSMRVLHDGSDVGINLPLKAKLAEFNLRLPDLDEDKDLLYYFSAIESTIRSRVGWKVHRDEVCLGFFNYEKYVIYLDLGGDAWPEGRKPWDHGDLTAMLGGGYSSPDSPISDHTRLDAVRDLATAREVYDADSSQVIAMIRAAEGLSIVVEGPPGTGKSQTITNMIAEAVAAQKTVLFVSAKRAALEVVKRKLDEAELGTMCLDLHDKLTNRREFYDELKRTVSREIALKTEEEKVERLVQLQQKLSAHSGAVNEPMPEFGTSPFQAMSILAALPPEEAEDRNGRIPFEALRMWKHGDIKTAVPLVEALQARLHSTQVPCAHPFWGTAIDYLDPARRLDLREDLVKAKAALAAAVDGMAEALSALRIQILATLNNLAVLRACLDQAIAAPPHDGVAVRTATWQEHGNEVATVIGALKRKREVLSTCHAQVKPEIWTADLLLVEQGYKQYAHCCYKFLIGDYRKARETLETYLTANAPSDPILRRQLVQNVRSAQAAESTIATAAATMQRLVGVQWKASETDPAVIEHLMAWVEQLGLHVESGELPRGLLDFFEGSHDNAGLQRTVSVAEAKCKEAEAAYATVADLLKFDRSTASSEDLAALLDRVSRWEDSLDLLPAYIAYNEARRHLMERALSAVVEVADTWPLASERLRTTFLRSYYSGVVREAMNARPELRTFEREGHEAAIREFQSLDDFKLKYNRAQVRLAHQKRLPTFDNAIGNLHALKMQCELTRKHKPIRWIMGLAGEAIQRIKPVFMMSPLSVAIHVPPELPPFDVVIFDEASQIKPEDALCSIIRAKQCIVVGDTRQMPPTSFFERVVDDDYLYEDSESGEVSYEARKLESVLSLMSAVTMGRMRRPDLRWHYRSVHPSLIQPSNEMFYENRLIVFPNSGTYNRGRRVGVVFHHLPHTAYESGARKRINQGEAEIVADRVVQHLLTQPEQSLLVAAMNKSQADLIYNEVQKRERLNPEAFRHFAECHPYEPLDVKNLENVQGDERDVIFISITYGRDAEGNLRQQFGPLLVDGGERRLNVLITRA